MEKQKLMMMQQQDGKHHEIFFTLLQQTLPRGVLKLTDETSNLIEAVGLYDKFCAGMDTGRVKRGSGRVEISEMHYFFFVGRVK